MTSREDDEAVAALKAELLAFLFDQGGPHMAAKPSPSTADIVGDIVADRLSDQLNIRLNQIEKSLTQSVVREHERAAALRTTFLNPWFLTAVAIALLSLGGNIGLGFLLIHKTVSEAAAPVDAADAQASDSCSAVSESASRAVSSESRSANEAKGKAAKDHKGAASSASDETVKAPDC